MNLWKYQRAVLMDEANGDDGSNTSTGGGTIDTTTQKTDDKTVDDKGGKKTTDEEARLLKEVMAKKQALQKTTEELASVKAIVSQLDELGGIDAIRALVTEKKTAEEKQLEAKGDFENLRKRMVDEHTKDVKGLRDALGAAETQISKLSETINELTIGSQFSQSNFIKEDLLLTPTKARQIYGQHFEFVDGKIVGYDKPRGSDNRTQLVDSMGEPVPFESALRQIIEADPEKDHLIRSKAKAGAGSNSNATKVVVQATNTRPLSGIELISQGLSKQMRR